ncbi:axotactin-like isoform X6 [Mytilus californianus]|uniref:axotactin-like isoform X6 n=1 Tax=Mytilus californianus TaxID=6549 RepID=UPI00224851C5|nr:axotactin-like isoform X6 [Mytilus californianus]
MKKLQLSKCLGHVILRLILLLFWSCKGLAQSSSSLFSSTPSSVSSIVSSSPDILPSSWTFVGKGYIAVYPAIFSNQNPDYKLSFRTRNSNAVIFCHILKELKETKHLSVGTYEFCGELHKGSLKITYKLNGNTDTFYIGKALNDDKWHSLEVQLLTSGDLIVTLDDEPLSNPVSVLDWNTLSSVILFGGKGTESQDHLYSGCLKNLQILDGNGTYNNINKPEVMGKVETGCQDKCLTGNQCNAETPCINFYSHVKCDCFGTNLQGPFCNQSGSTKITLRGYEWITYQLYDKPSDRVFSDKNKFSLQFRSDRGSGVLIYAVGTYPHDSHVIASVHEGVVTASVGFQQDVTLEANLGIATDDFRQKEGWHNLTIVHNKNTVTFILDEEVTVRTTESSNYYLSLDSKIFFGGGNNFVITKGLQVTQNFVGCLKNVYVDDVSLVYEMKHGNDRVIHSGGHKPYYGCHKTEDIPISFPKSGTMIVLDTPSNTDLQVEFGFRTVRDVAIIFYAQTISTLGYGIGFFEIWIRHHQVILQLEPSTRNPDLSKHIVIDHVVNDNKWHTLHLHFTDRFTKIKIDDRSNQINHTDLLELTGEMVIGHGPRLAYDANDGFVGCIRNLAIQDKVKDAINLLQTNSAVYGVILDGCHLVPYCEGGPHCEHGGKCLSNWDGVACDCSDTAYEGHACHFAKYRRSCDDYYQAGYKQSGAYQIDLDSTGPLQPVYVWCEMEYQYQGEKYGMTKIDHNFIPDTRVRGKGLYDMRKLLSYREMTRQELVELTESSIWCEQLVDYDCYRAPLELGKSTIFQSARGEILELRYNTDADSLCSCRKGTCPQNRCQCDKGHAQWEKDSGYIRYKQHLPITELRIYQSKSPAPQTSANLSLGPLKCWGEALSKVANAVTFKRSSAYLHLRSPWRSSNLQFMFRTHQTTALLLNQTHTSDNSNSLVIALISEKAVQFSVRINNKTLEDIIQFDMTIGDGKWHYVAIEMDTHNIRYTVDVKRQILDMPGKQIPSFNGSLYVGGYINENVMPGLKGCLRGFHYNEKDIDLSKMTDPSIPEVSAGCTASCESKPCQNQAKCIEHWGSYTCICTNKWAHWGDSCERNINKDQISFDGTATSFLDLEGFKGDNLLDSTIILSFRTYDSRAILLYIHDAMNNFLQLELEKGDRLKLSFNHFKTIVSESLIYNSFNDGEWKQIVIQERINKNNLAVTKMFVNSPDNMVIVPYSRLKLPTYSSAPFKRYETVRPPRSPGVTNTYMSEYYRLFVGGTLENTSDINQLSGCIRGLKIGDKVFSLQQEAHHNPAVAAMCGSGCSSSPCKHNGKCIEKWDHNKFYCDCAKTNYAGDQCQMEASGNFSGNAVLEYSFELLRNARFTTSENLSLSFQTSAVVGKKQVVLAVIMSSKHPDHDLLLFVLTADGVMVKHYQNRLNYGLRVEGKFADGKPHKLQYWRSGDEMLLTVAPLSNLDDVRKMTVPNIRNPLDDLDVMMLGGVVLHKLKSDIENKDKFVNFTGCISEVLFTPVENEPYIINPLKELRSFANQSIIIHGDDIDGCSLDTDADQHMTTDSTYTTDSETDQDRTMPPWNPGPAETIYLNAPPSTTTMKTTILPTPKPTIPTIPKTPVSTTDRLNVSKSSIGHTKIGGTATDLEIMIALAIICGLMLISVLIALFLCKKRKHERYVMKKVPPDDLELKVPLNHTSSPPPSQKPYDHIARLDEFSMISATLGPAKRRKENGVGPGTEPLLNDSDLSPGEYPVQSTFYNKKKNRPASSISEVLEEIERQKREKDCDENSGPDEEAKDKQGGDLEWDPSNDRTPLTSKQEEDGSEADPLQVLEQQKELTMEGNGDSGYEAESRKDPDDEIINITPPSPNKMYMYDISGQNTNNWTSTPNRKLLEYEESGT